MWELLISSCMKSWWLSMACRQLVLNLTLSRSSVTQTCVVWCPALCVSACHKEVFARSEWHSDLCNSMWHSVQILEIHHHRHWVLHAKLIWDWPGRLLHIPAPYVTSMWVLYLCMNTSQLLSVSQLCKVLTLGHGKILKLRKRLNFATHGQDGGWYIAGDFVLVEPSPPHHRG